MKHHQFTERRSHSTVPVPILVRRRRRRLRLLPRRLLRKASTSRAAHTTRAPARRNRLAHSTATTDSGTPVTTYVRPRASVSERIAVVVVVASSPSTSIVPSPSSSARVSYPAHAPTLSRSDVHMSTDRPIDRLTDRPTTTTTRVASRDPARSTDARVEDPHPTWTHDESRLKNVPHPRPRPTRDPRRVDVTARRATDAGARPTRDDVHRLLMGPNRGGGRRFGGGGHQEGQRAMDKAKLRREREREATRGSRATAAAEAKRPEFLRGRGKTKDRRRGGGGGGDGEGREEEVVMSARAVAAVTATLRRLDAGSSGGNGGRGGGKTGVEARVDVDREDVLRKAAQGMGKKGFGEGAIERALRATAAARETEGDARRRDLMSRNDERSRGRWIG